MRVEGCEDETAVPPSPHINSVKWREQSVNGAWTRRANTKFEMPSGRHDGFVMRDAVP